MAEHVDVDLADLRYGGQRLSGWHTDTADVFDTGHTQMQDAAAGWVGSSGRALDEKLQALRKSATTVTDRLGDHSSKFFSSANTIETTDQRSGTALRPSTSSGSDDSDDSDGGGTGPLLNL